MSLYSPSEQTTNALNGAGNMTDAIGTINPAALNSGGKHFHTIARHFCLIRLNPPDCNLLLHASLPEADLSACVTVLIPQDPNHRGTKRSRSPDTYEDYAYGDVNGKSCFNTRDFGQRCLTTRFYR